MTALSRLNALTVLVAVSLGGSCTCVDPTKLEVFACDDGGACAEPQVCCEGLCRASCSTGGGAGGGAAGGGTAGGGTAGGTGGAGGGVQACGAANCAGCCDTTGMCVAGTARAKCGLGGVSCMDCGAGQQCTAGGACVNLAPVGTPCTTGDSCASTHCVEGFCCDRPCTGACSTCKASGSEGRCQPLAEGAAGTPTCAPLACDGVDGGCPATCASARQCVAGDYCDAQGACVVKKVDGASCSANVECANGSCVDNVCCNGGCSGSCDRCDLTGHVGTCWPSPANDPGSPACPGVVCNGTLHDCPILCSSGCPTTTWCSGTYCAAKKGNGLNCGAPAECITGNCVNGVCCDGPCTGACNACSVAAGALTDGTCAMVGSSRVCRTSAGPCDLEERCSGASASCPANAFQASGYTCQASGYTAWSTCATGTNVCATSGTQTRTRTDHTCDGSGTCGSSPATETASCTQMTDGLTCNATVNGAWGACTAATNACAGNQTRTVTTYVCGGGVCQTQTTTQTQSCNVAAGVGCGSTAYGAWGTCGAASGSCTGTQSRTVTDYACDGSGTCRTTTTTGTQSCTLAQGATCNANQTGSWGTCSGAPAGSCAGTQARTVTAYTCNGSTCQGATTTQTQGCTEGVGTVCNAQAAGAWGSCNAAAGSCTGSQSRTVTDYACDSSGACRGSTSTGSQGCTLGQGVTCNSPQATAWTSCSGAPQGSCAGSQSQTITTFACNGTTCQGSSTTATQGCSMPVNTTCNATAVGGWSACSAPPGVCSGSQSRTITSYACDSGGNCSGSGSSESQGCTANDGQTCQGSAYGPWGACGGAPNLSCSGTQSRTRTDYTCGAGTCNAADTAESQGCTEPDGTDCSTSCYCFLPACASFHRSCANGACINSDLGTYCAPCGGGGCIPQ